MPALLLLPTYYTESSSIPSPLPCCTARLANSHKQFELHSQFWKPLRDIGLWQHPRRLQNKTKFTTKDDPREISPPRIIQSSNYYMEMHDGTFPSVYDNVRRLDNFRSFLVHVRLINTCPVTMSEQKRAADDLKISAFIASDEMVSATHLRLQYHTADEHVLYSRQTLLALETNVFCAGVWR